MKTLAVLLPTYNAVEYLKTAIDSVLNQTFSDFDLYVYDDCSLDKTQELVESYADARVYYFRNPQNIGIAKTLNLGLQYLEDRYEFIARMDADDWCFSERFEKQLEYLKTHTEIVMCGTQGYWSKDFSEIPANPWKVPLESNEIKINLLFAASFGHSSIMFRSKFIKQNTIRYDESIKTCEDWDLWCKIVETSKIGNLDNFLMKYRILHDSNHRSPQNKDYHKRECSKVISNHWKIFNQNISSDEVFSYYYQENQQECELTMEGLNKLVFLFNDLYKQVSNCEGVDCRKLSYKFLRFIIGYRKRKQQRKFALKQWVFLFKHIRFTSSMNILKQLIQ